VRSVKRSAPAAGGFCAVLVVVSWCLPELSSCRLDHAAGYIQRSFSLAPYIGQTVTLKFIGSEDSTNQTSFVIDDTAINVSS
jgi:hypothetical protein